MKFNCNYQGGAKLDDRRKNHHGGDKLYRKIRDRQDYHSQNRPGGRSKQRRDQLLFQEQKTRLVRRALEIALDNAFDMENFKDSIGLPINERLVSVMEGMTVGSIKFPNLTRALISGLLTSTDGDAPVVRKLHGFLDKLQDEIIEARPEKSQG